MPNKLLQCAEPIISLASIFSNAEQGKDLAENFHEEILKIFEQFEKQAFAQGIAVNATQQAKYGLAAFIDEHVLSSAWPGRQQWMGKPLQLQFFGDHLAGENFFQRLQNLRQNPQENIDILEIYFICLQLGFEGMYRKRGLEHLLALQVDLRSQIELERGVVSPHLSAANLLEKNIVTQVGERLPYWVIGSVTLAIMFFIFLGFTVAVDHQANLALKNINLAQE